jgi:hypothetical protein
MIEVSRMDAMRGNLPGHGEQKIIEVREFSIEIGFMEWQ